MLVDYHKFEHCASVPWPVVNQLQVDWIDGVKTLEYWLNTHVGHRLQHWAWNDSQDTYHVGVAFKWDQDRLLFVIAWT